MSSRSPRKLSRKSPRKLSRKLSSESLSIINSYFKKPNKTQSKSRFPNSTLATPVIYNKYFQNEKPQTRSQTRSKSQSRSKTRSKSQTRSQTESLKMNTMSVYLLEPLDDQIDEMNKFVNKIVPTLGKEYAKYRKTTNITVKQELGSRLNAYRVLFNLISQYSVLHKNVRNQRSVYKKDIDRLVKLYNEIKNTYEKNKKFYKKNDAQKFSDYINEIRNTLGLINNNYVNDDLIALDKQTKIFEEIFRKIL